MLVLLLDMLPHLDPLERFLSISRVLVEDERRDLDGVLVADICRKAGINQATYFNWKKKYDGLQPGSARRCRMSRGAACPGIRPDRGHRSLP